MDQNERPISFVTSENLTELLMLSGACVSLETKEPSGFYLNYAKGSLRLGPTNWKFLQAKRAGAIFLFLTEEKKINDSLAMMIAYAVGKTYNGVTLSFL